jgi:PAS domain-containing protein
MTTQEQPAVATTVDDAITRLVDELDAVHGDYRRLYKLLDRIADCTPGIVFAKNIDGRYIYMNKVMRSWVGATDSDQVEGTTDMDWAHRNRSAEPDNKDYHTFGEVCVNSDTVTIDLAKPCRFLEHGTVRGAYQYLQVDKAPLYDDNDKTVGVVGVGIDVTERIMAQAAVFKRLVDRVSELNMTDTFADIVAELHKLFDRHKYTNREAT